MAEACGVPTVTVQSYAKNHWPKRCDIAADETPRRDIAAEQPPRSDKPDPPAPPQEARAAKTAEAEQTQGEAPQIRLRWVLGTESMELEADASPGHLKVEIRAATLERARALMLGALDLLGK